MASEPYVTRKYECGCSANGQGNIPKTCPEHGLPTTIQSELEQAGKIAERAVASEQPMAAPEARQPKNWRLVLQQIIDCRDERDKVLMIAQDALNMSQPEPQDTGDDYVIYNGKRYVPEIARAQSTERRPGESWSCFVCHEPTDALFALCGDHKLATPKGSRREYAAQMDGERIRSRIRWLIAKYHGNHSDNRNDKLANEIMAALQGEPGG